MKFECDFDYGYDMKWAWRFIRRGQFSKAIRRFFSFESPISPNHPGIFVSVFGVNVYIHTKG